MIQRNDITGLVLAGGRGSRMGGEDKGLQEFQGQPLAQHAIERLRPQVSALWLNANRHLDHYAKLGSLVCQDTISGHPGPLAGILAGLQVCPTPWLAVVPCDVPRFPMDLVARLAAGLTTTGTRLSMAVTKHGDRRMVHPVFCLLPVDLRDDLAAALSRDERRVAQWMGRHRCAEVMFERSADFANVNTWDDLRQLEKAQEAEHVGSSRRVPWMSSRPSQ